MQYEIKFGSAFSQDHYGFIGKGSISIDKESVMLKGKRLLSPWLRFLIVIIIMFPFCFLPFKFFSSINNNPAAAFLAVIFLPLLAPFLILVFFLIFSLVLYLSNIFNKESTLVIKKEQISNCKKTKRKITFNSLNDNSKNLKTIFIVKDKETANSVFSLLNNG